MRFALGPCLLTGPDPARLPELYDELLEQAHVAEEYGFDALWVGEHHGTAEGFCPSPTLVAAAIASAAPALRLGVCLALPLTHPIPLAEDVALVDCISNGRAMVAVSSGERAGDLAARGIPPDEQASRFAEALEIVLRSWAPTPFAFDGRHWRVPGRRPENVFAAGIDQVSVTPKPVQASLPVWLAARTADEVRLAAQLGLPLLGRAHETFAELRAKYALYDELLAKAGRREIGTVRPLVREVYIAESDARAEAEAAGPLRWLYERYRAWGLLPEVPDDFAALSRERFVVGGVDRCVAELQRYRDELGVNYVICRLALPGLPHLRALDAIRLFGQAVVSEFRMASFPAEIRMRSRPAGEAS